MRFRTNGRSWALLTFRTNKEAMMPLRSGFRDVCVALLSSRGGSAACLLCSGACLHSVCVTCCPLAVHWLSTCCPMPCVCVTCLLACFLAGLAARFTELWSCKHLTNCACTRTASSSSSCSSCVAGCQCRPRGSPLFGHSVQPSQQRRPSRR